MTIRTISEELKNRYGSKVLKLSLSSGCTCPNRDGRAGSGGCSFCSEGGSGEFASDYAPLEEQIREAKKRVDRKFPKDLPESARKYVAYFQSFSNTYGPAEKLEPMYEEVLQRPEIVALSIGTRPDCIPDDILNMLIRLNMIKPVWVELGLQTIHEKTAEAFNRGYRLPVFEETYQRLKKAGLTVIVHVILGLPGESRADILDTVRYLAALTPVPDGIKLQMLQILKGSRMGEEWLHDPFPLLSMEEYTDLVTECLSILPEETVIHRMTGDPPRNLLIAPQWTTDKKRVLNMLKSKIQAAARLSGAAIGNMGGQNDYVISGQRHS